MLCCHVYLKENLDMVNIDRMIFGLLVGGATLGVGAVVVGAGVELADAKIKLLMLVECLFGI